MIFCSIPERGVDTEYLSACYLGSWPGRSLHAWVRACSPELYRCCACCNPESYQNKMTAFSGKQLSFQDSDLNVIISCGEKQ